MHSGVVYEITRLVSFKGSVAYNRGVDSSDSYRKSRRSRSIMSHVELVISDIDKLLDESDSREEWQLQAKGVLVHWLGVMYDEGVGERRDLETSLNIARRQVEVLGQLNNQLLHKLADVDRYGVQDPDEGSEGDGTR